MKSNSSKMVAIVLLIFLVGCSAGLTGRITADTDNFKKICIQNGHQFMVMPPARDWVPISREPCAGCMVEGDHYCTLEEYTEVTER